VPAAAVHAMVPAVGTSANFEVLDDAQYDVMPGLSCQNPTAPMPCYTPQQIRTAYNMESVINAGTTGAGQTIVIIAGFQDPTLLTDLARFDQTFGLPATTPLVTAPDGLTEFDPSSAIQKGWALEIATDVEWAHAIAPGATIHLVLAASGDDADILSATRYAVENDLGDVISQSFGEAESCPTAEFLAEEHAVFKAAHARGMTLLASSGDVGAAERTCDGTLVAAVSTPASDPEVTAVGGTRLAADPVSGAYKSEVAWNDQYGASGGGFSQVYKRPGYQAPFIDDNTRRGIPDVALGASLYGAVIVAFRGKFGRVIGTSPATAQWAGIAALSNEMAGHRQGPLNTRLYHVGKSSSYSEAFHDITSGGNRFAGFAGSSGVPGWDPVTGLGSPNVAVLLPLLS